MDLKLFTNSFCFQGLKVAIIYMYHLLIQSKKLNFIFYVKENSCKNKLYFSSLTQSATTL